MISRISGILEAVKEGRAELSTGDLTYTLLVPGCDGQQLAARIGQTVTLHTLHYLEGQGQGTSYTPRLIGFQTPEDREFFEVFTTVKGLGNRKALRALQLPFARVAEAISAKDVDLLKSLPEIGKRTAETIVAELNGKVDRFIREDRATDDQTEEAAGQQEDLAHDAVAVLVSLGEPKLSAVQLVDRALTADPNIGTADALIAAAFRLRELPT